MAQGLSEQWIIRRVAERFGQTAGDVVGIGDDAAVLPLAGNGNLQQLVTTDTLIEGVHFDLSYMTLADVGYKSLAVNLSDINAMGGESVAALGTLGVPKGAEEVDIDSLLNGVEAALQLCKDSGQSCALIGGDTVAAPQWMIGITVLGSLEGQPLLRSGARPGDQIWHSGVLGLSGVGLLELSRRGGALSPPAQVPVGTDSFAEDGGRQVGPSTAAHLRPKPPLQLGPWLQRNGYATSAQDLSDSLSQVVLQLAAASAVGVQLDFQGYEFAPELVQYVNGTLMGSSFADFLLARAEDYQLLFTAPPEFEEAIADAPVACTRIGTVVDAEAGNSYRDEQGRKHDLIALGFEHL